MRWRNGAQADAAARGGYAEVPVARPNSLSRPVAGRYTVRSVARALRLVEAVAEGPAEGRSLSDLARELGTSKSTTLALARTLSAFGYPAGGPARPRYALGTALIRLGDMAGQQIPLGDLCRPLIDELAEDQDDLPGRGQRQGYPVFIDRVDGPGRVRFHTPLGQREVPYASAAGKAILATMDEAGGAAAVRRDRPAARTAHTITDIGTLLDNLARSRRRGFAVDDEEDAEGVFCVGAAFFGHDGGCAGAVSVTGIKGDLPAWRVEELGQAVRRCADRVSETLGGSRVRRPAWSPEAWRPPRWAAWRLVRQDAGRGASLERRGGAAAAGELLIRPELVGLCGTDLEIVDGTLDPAYIRYPLVLGHEWTGTVAADARAGRGRVVVEGIVPCGHCARCRTGETNLCATYDEIGFTRDGAAARHVGRGGGAGARPRARGQRGGRRAGRAGVGGLPCAVPGRRSRPAAGRWWSATAPWRCSRCGCSGCGPRRDRPARPPGGPGGAGRHRRRGQVRDRSGGGGHRLSTW